MADYAYILLAPPIEVLSLDYQTQPTPPTAANATTATFDMPLLGPRSEFDSHSPTRGRADAVVFYVEYAVQHPRTKPSNGLKGEASDGSTGDHGSSSGDACSDVASVQWRRGQRQSVRLLRQAPPPTYREPTTTSPAAVTLSGLPLAEAADDELVRIKCSLADARLDLEAELGRVVS